jgi:hypothetical protein
MARFYGEVGFGFPKEDPEGSGIWKDTITERQYRGDEVRASLASKESESLNADISVSNSISIVADDYAISHIAHMKFVRWRGARWTITNVEIQRPRLILTLGGVYNPNTP